MPSGHGVHFIAFAAEYEVIAGRARRIVTGFPPLLRDLARPLLPQLGAGTFARIVALLPYWVADLLDPLPSPEQSAVPSPPSQNDSLGLANLLGWWSYRLQDQLLDRETDRPERLPLANAFYATSLHLFQRLVAGDAAFWQAFEALSLASAEAHCWEQRRHFRTFADLDGEGFDRAAFDFDDLDRLADRSALLQLSTVAQLRLRGYGQDHPLHAALRQMLHHYAIGRQIGDDWSDWAADLERGRLNYVSARIARRMKEKGAVQDYAGLDVEWMVGHFLYDDELLTDIYRVALGACRRAAESIAPYAPRYLGALVDELREQTESNYRAALEARGELQALFSPLHNIL